MVELPKYLQRVVVFLGAEARHNLYARHLRDRMTISPEQRKLDLVEYMSSAWGAGDPESEEAYHEYSSLEYSYVQFSEEMDRYLWGLATAGVYHRWEIETVSVIKALSKGELLRKKNPKLEDIKIALNSLNFSLEQSEDYDILTRTQLIANTIKHGAGSSFDALKRDYLPIFGTTTPAKASPDDIYLNVTHFDEAVGTISKIWKSFEDKWRWP